MTTDHKNVPPEMSAKMQELRDVFGSVPNQLNIPQPPEDQSQPGPWWIVPGFAVFALILVAAMAGLVLVFGGKS